MNKYKSRWFVAFLCTTFFSLESFGQDVEEVVITGSRIKRDSLNSAAQVTTITSEDIEASSGLMTADVLRNSIYNSFGSTGPTAVIKCSPR